jgi:hypothetical protein
MVTSEPPTERSLEGDLNSSPEEPGSLGEVVINKAVIFGLDAAAADKAAAGSPSANPIMT